MQAVKSHGVISEVGSYWLLGQFRSAHASKCSEEEHIASDETSCQAQACALALRPLPPFVRLDMAGFQRAQGTSRKSAMTFREYGVRMTKVSANSR